MHRLLQRQLRRYLGSDEQLPEELERFIQVVDAAYRVHSTLGPGLLESVYEIALVYELKNREIRV